MFCFFNIYKIITNLPAFDNQLSTDITKHAHANSVHRHHIIWTEKINFCQTIITTKLNNISSTNPVSLKEK